MSQPVHEIHYGKAARTLVMGTKGVIAAGHPLASLAGLGIMQRGGNAVDAAVAAGFVLAVVKHEACGLGGDMFSLVYMKDEGKVRALNASGPAPGNATIDAFKSRGLDAVPTSGPLSIAIPGAVDGWLELHRQYGTVDLADVCADAITLARDGFPLYLSLAQSIQDWAPSSPGIHRYFRAPLEDLTPGRMLRQPELAQVLEAIVHGGRDGFYGGDVAARMCAGIRAQGGLFEERDLEGTFAEWMEPLSTDYRGYQLLEQPPVSQGFVVLTMMNLLAGYDCKSLSRTELAHVMVEAKKIAFEDRIRHLGDPRFVDPEVRRLISREYADARRADIADAAGPVTSSYAAAGADTTYLCAADGDGNAISLIESVFSVFGSRVVAGRYRPRHEQPPVQRQTGSRPAPMRFSRANGPPTPSTPTWCSTTASSWRSGARRGRTTSPRPTCRCCTTCWTSRWIPSARWKPPAGVTCPAPRPTSAIPRCCGWRRDFRTRWWRDSPPGAIR